jgi:hypothetical protein
MPANETVTLSLVDNGAQIRPPQRRQLLRNGSIPITPGVQRLKRSTLRIRLVFFAVVIGRYCLVGKLMLHEAVETALRISDAVFLKARISNRSSALVLVRRVMSE